MADSLRLGKSAIQCSPLGLGAMTWGEKAWSTAYGGTGGRADEEAAFKASLKGGVNLFDTAEMYGSGNSERRLGQLAQGSKAVIATKFMPRPPRTSGALPKALDASLKRLQTDSVDLYQIHFPVPWVSIPKLMHRLADAVEARKVRAVGVSNYSEVQMRQAHAVLESRGVPLATNQVQYSLLYRKPESDGVLDACKELGVTILAYMPLAMGALTGKYAIAKPTDRMRTRMTPTFNPAEVKSAALVTESLARIVKTHDATASQVALRWLIQQGVVPIPGAKDGEQAKQNAGALKVKLSVTELAEISALASDWKHIKWPRAPRLSDRD
jgi:aryl-alcohol dehydrogenase-like predicted oxidoreductase